MPSQANCALPQGFQLDQYRIERQLSLGGFSIVYLAFDAHDTPVAIKEYLPNSLALRKGGPASMPINDETSEHDIVSSGDLGDLDIPDFLR